MMQIRCVVELVRWLKSLSAGELYLLTSFGLLGSYSIARLSGEPSSAWGCLILLLLLLWWLLRLIARYQP